MPRRGRQAPSPAGRFRRAGQRTAGKAVPDEQGAGLSPPRLPILAGCFPELRFTGSTPVTGEPRDMLCPYYHDPPTVFILFQLINQITFNCGKIH